MRQYLDQRSSPARSGLALGRRRRFRGGPRMRHRELRRSFQRQERDGRNRRRAVRLVPRHGRAATAELNKGSCCVITGSFPHPEELARASVSKDEAADGPHGSPGDAKHRPATAYYYFVPFATASLMLDLLGHSRLLTMRGLVTECTTTN